MIPLGIVSAAHAPTPTGPLLDSFNRADGPVGNLDTGQPWIEEPGSTWAVVGNTLDMSSGTNKSLHVDIGAPSMRVAANRLAVNGRFCSIVASASSFNDFYKMEIDQFNNSIYVGRTTAGTNTWLQNEQTGTGYVGRFELVIEHGMAATQVSVYVNTTLLMTLSDTGSGRPSGNYAGFRNTNTGTGVWDDFEGEAL